MRVVLLILVLVSFLSSGAQTHLPLSTMNYIQWQPFPVYNAPGDSTHLIRQWYFNKYIGLSSGYGFVNGGSAYFLSAPVGLQLTHPLNNNLYAFAAVSVAPSFVTFSHTFMDPGLNKSFPGSSWSNGFGMNSNVQLGLMYINDAKTFSLSGSIGIDRSSFPIYPVYPTNRTNTKRQ
jgi:hypothetical protein